MLMTVLCMQVITPLLGKQNVYNVLAAVGVGIALNVNLQVPVAGNLPAATLC